MADTEAGTIADLARASAQPATVTTHDGRVFLITAGDAVVKEVTDPHGLVNTRPGRVVQAVTVQTLDSLVDYTKAFQTLDAVLFADIDKNSIHAALDYHAPSVAGADPVAAHVSHSARLTLPFSVEWKTWTEIDGKLMSQLAFARFLEENAADIAAPSGADLLETCRDLQAKRTVDFRAAVRTNTDSESFEYSEDTQTSSRNKGGDVEVPTKFLLRLPIYFGGETTELYAYLRWDLVDGKLMLGVKLSRPEHVRQAVFRQIVQDAAERTDAPAVFGRLGA